MYDKTHLQLGNVVTVFERKYFDKLYNYFSTVRDYRTLQSIVVYLEYVGPNSFAGLHDPNDKMYLVLIDVWKHGKGWVEPKDFVKDFTEFGIPEVIYRGNLNQEFIQDIKNNIYNLKEGVVAKVTQQTKRVDKKVWMVKIKANQWYEKLKAKYGQKAIIDDLEGNLSILN